MKKRALVIIGIAAACLVVIILYFVYLNVFVNKHRLKLEHAQLGGSEYRNTAAESSIMPSYMWRRVNSILIEDGYLMSDYMLEGRLADQDAVPSGKYLLQDQALLLLKYLAESDRSSSIDLVKKVNADFANGDGSYRGTVFKDGTEDLSYTNTDELCWLEAYLEFYSAYGSGNDLENIGNLTGIVFDSNGVMKPEELHSTTYVSSENVSGEVTDEDLDPSFETVYGAEDVTVAEGTNSEEDFKFSGVKISDMDLELIFNLEQNGLIPAGTYDRYSGIVTGALVSPSIPYYAYAYATDGNGNSDYVYSCSRAATISVGESLITMVHLAERGLLPEGVYNEFKSSLINDSILKSNYYLATGLTGGSEITSGYQDALQLARLKQDTDLYRTICRIMSVRVATNKQSRALYLIFINENNRYVFYSHENIKTYLIVNGMFAV
ncbi:hypothetical protein SAMN02910456_00724 [Ruminococcaceae bacterium YRB3002]|nr:hypothetical protein SAMN02910456_00724 [Ruminococcaceae bacterium YRB3002]